MSAAGETQAPLRLGLLASGSGSNLQAILDACASGQLRAEPRIVVCNVAGAGALARADRAGIQALLLRHQDFPSREAYDEAVVAALVGAGVELVCLAGFMRLLTPVLLRAFPQRIVNIHPSLLPAFPGLHAQRQALRAGVRIAGCTVHVVDEGTDTGPILAQVAVPVLDGDDEATLSARILRQEHACYVRVLRWWSEGRFDVQGRKVTVRATPGQQGAQVQADSHQALCSPAGLERCA